MLAENMLVDAPLRALTMMSNGSMSVAQVEGLVELLNGNFMAGIKLMRQRKP